MTCRFRLRGEGGAIVSYHETLRAAVQAEWEYRKVWAALEDPAPEEIAECWHGDLAIETLVLGCWVEVPQ